MSKEILLKLFKQGEVLTVRDKIIYCKGVSDEYDSFQELIETEKLSAQISSKDEFGSFIIVQGEIYAR